MGEYIISKYTGVVLTLLFLFIGVGVLINVIILRPFPSTTEIFVLGSMGLLIWFGLLLFTLDRLGWVSLGFMDAFAEFAIKFPGLAEVGSFLILPTMWFLFVKAWFLGVTIFAGDFSIFIYFGFLCLAVFLVIISVGLYEFIEERWGFLKTAAGLLASMMFLYIVIISFEFFLESLAENERLALSFCLHFLSRI